MIDADVPRLKAEERYARERHDLYRARAYGGRPTSATRMRELKRTAELSGQRLRQAKSKRQPLRP